MRVVSWNIDARGDGLGERIDRLTNFDADILLLQEVPRRAAPLLAAAPGVAGVELSVLHSEPAGGPGARLGTAILTTERVQLKEVGQIPEQRFIEAGVRAGLSELEVRERTGWLHRNLYADLEVDGTPLRVCSLHARPAAIHPDARRLGELEAKKQRGEDLSYEEFGEFQELQESGLVHRDIKPQNIILTRQGAKLLDFNIASRVGDPVMTVSGTPPYQAPDVDYTMWDVSTDLFAVGVTLYELLCNGEHPYPVGRPMLGEEVRDPAGLRPDLPGALHAFLTRACGPYRDQRFETALEMRSELADIRAEM